MTHIKTRYGSGKLLKVSMFKTKNGYEVMSYSHMMPDGRIIGVWREVEHFLLPTRKEAEKVFSRIVEKF